MDMTGKRKFNRSRVRSTHPNP